MTLVREESTIYILHVTESYHSPAPNLCYFMDYMLRKNVTCMKSTDIAPYYKTSGDEFQVSFKKFTFSTEDDMKEGLNIMFELTNGMPNYVTNDCLLKFRKEM